MSREEARRQILEIDDWRHPYDLDGVQVRLAQPWYRAWHHWRLGVDLAHIEAIVGDLAGKRVLDCACNDGYYGFQYAGKGASVVGIDARDDAIARAGLIKDYFNYRDTQHLRADLETLDCSRWISDPFDVTLFYGILYHLSDPIGILRNLGAVTKKVIAVQTFVHGQDLEPILRLQDERIELPGMGTRAIACTPSQAAVVKMLDHAGFDMVLRVSPHPYKGSMAPGSGPAWHWAFFYAIKGMPSELDRIKHVLQVTDSYDPALPRGQVVRIDVNTPPLNPYAAPVRGP